MSSSDREIIVLSSETAEKNGNESDQEEKGPHAHPITKSVKKKFTKTRNKQKQDGHYKGAASKWNRVPAPKTSIKKKRFGGELNVLSREQPNRSVLEPIVATGITELNPNRINIFNNDFLEHNQSVEQELKDLRKKIRIIENHNGLADLTNEKLKEGIMKIEKENEAKEKHNLELELRLRNFSATWKGHAQARK